MSDKQEYLQMTIFLTPDQKRYIHDRAEANQRSMSAEIRMILSSLMESESEEE